MTGSDQKTSNRFERKSFFRIAGNVTSMLTSNIMVRATSFVMYILVARYLGTYEFGQLALAVSLFYSVHIFALAGLKTLVIREVAKDKEKTNQFFINASVIVTLTSIFSIFFIAIFVRVMDYSPDTSNVIMLLFLGMIPFVLTQICEGVFQAWEKMEFIAFANVPLNILQTIAAFVLLVLGFDIHYVVLSMVLSYVAILLVEWVFIRRFIIKPTFKLDLGFSKNILKDSSPFLGIQGTNAVKSSITVVLLSTMLGEEEVGLYSAAHQLLVPLDIIFNNVVSGIFPLMVRKFEAGIGGLRRVTKYLIEFLMAIAIPAMVGLFFVAEPLLLVFYGDRDFIQAATVLRILVFLPIGNVLTTVLGQTLWASRREKISLRIAIVNTLIKGAVGYILIDRLGLIGAASATALVMFINVLQHYLPVARLFSGIELNRLVWRPLLATILMVAFLMIASDMNIFILISLSVILYAIGLAILIVWSSGGIDQFKSRYGHLWMKP